MDWNEKDEVRRGNEMKNVIDTDLGHQNGWYLCQMILFDLSSSY
jgi:hypothetical protein